jgi:hypothetical protein
MPGAADAAVRTDPAEITLDELRVELLYPMDEDAERFLRTR